MDKTDEIVQYFVINSQVEMSSGKIAVQVAHVATIITKNLLSTSKGTILFYEWMDKYNQKKIMLRGKEKDLLKLIDQGFYYIRDNGLTEIPSGTLTCVGLPPMYRSEAQKYVKRLQLY